MTPLWATGASKQLVIHVSHEEISTLILIVWLLHNSSVGAVYVVCLRIVFSTV